MYLGANNLWIAMHHNRFVYLMLPSQRLANANALQKVLRKCVKGFISHYADGDGLYRLARAPGRRFAKVWPLAGCEYRRRNGQV